MPVHILYVVLVYLMKESQDITACCVRLAEESVHDHCDSSCQAVLVLRVDALEEMAAFLG